MHYLLSNYVWCLGKAQMANKSANVYSQAGADKAINTAPNMLPITGNANKIIGCNFSLCAASVFDIHEENREEMSSLCLYGHRTVAQIQRSCFRPNQG